ncbi:hypothetical protein QZM46_17740 [Burkholderia vietnamiensis]|uniref:C1q-like domain-containing protein n=1 Tax=Burkholderia TaxID=32008 RepID=UPI00265420B2|nr:MULTISPECIES: hypothetical protein [Burkholderia]MDN7429038.1 hypothetical protein [Burkholderia sp. AU45388]MDN7553165.1 hypothetical protein [Burkholderia vietnamiensis]HDR9093386.1 hypothetical protein [Burkholderia vietnamiensis]
MYQIDAPGAVSSLPPPAPAGTPGYFTGGDPATSTPATILDSDWFNAVMMELINVVEAAGIPLAKADNTQLLQALQKLCLPQAGVSCFSVKQLTAQAFSAGVPSTVNFQAKQFDDLNEFSLVSGLFVATNPGFYSFNASIHGTSNGTANRILDLYVNNVPRVRMQEADGSVLSSSLAGSSGPVQLAAGDNVRVVYSTSVADTLDTGATLTYFSGVRVK